MSALKNINVLMMDINEKMLEQATKRKEYREHKKNIDFIVSDAENIPLASNSIDCIAIAFGIRNVASIENALLEINRVLKCGGKFLCLEFSNVEVPLLKKFYSFYSKNIIPEIGSYVVKDRRSYQYLVESIERFPKQDELTDLFTKSGFINSKYTSKETTDTIITLSERLEKIPLVVNDFPGFISNRILMPMINEAIESLDQGVADVKNIDGIMKGWGIQWVRYNLLI